jgi:transposase
MFIAMVSLIISSYIHKLMVESGLDKKYTIQKLINKLNMLKIKRSGLLEALSPITKDMRVIYQAFGIKIE